MTSVIFITNEGWRRSGECNRCGDCCIGNPYTGQSGGYCPHVERRSDGTFFCNGRDTDYYKAACQFYPSSPKQILDKPRCSYSFEGMENADN